MVPKLQPFTFPKDPSIGQSALVSCYVVSGGGPLKFTWFKDGRVITQKERAKVEVLRETISTLTIPAIGAEDTGNYTCQVSNSAGSDRFSAMLLVTGQSCCLRTVDDKFLNRVTLSIPSNSRNTKGMSEWGKALLTTL